MPNEVKSGAGVTEIPTSQGTTASAQMVDSAANQVESQPAGGSRTYTQEEVDRTVKARIDKQNEKHRAELEKFSKAAKEAEARADAAEKEAAGLKADQARNAEVAKAAAAAGVSADILGRMSGDTVEEIAANAAILAAAIPKAAYPSIPDKGGQSAASITKADIDKIKDPRAQLRAIRENPELFK